VAGDAAIIEWLLQKTRTYIFATAAPPLLASALRTSLALIAAADDLREGLRQRIAQLRNGLAELPPQLGWHLLPSHTAVQALVIGSNEAALAVMESLRQRGLWVPAIRPPTVPPGTARLRIALSAAHTESDVQELLVALAAHAADCIGARPEQAPGTSAPSAAIA
jgi:8-amino-7-oxononanoate synthase